MKVLVTGGAGFIGSAVVRSFLQNSSIDVLNVDKLTHAANLRALEEHSRSPRYKLLQADICDGPLMRDAFADFQPDVVMHLAAESHVDRSIMHPSPCIETNLVGTCSILEAALFAWESYKAQKQKDFRFIQVSTDEVFGSLGDQGSFSVASQYAPSSPYAASKAGGDHLARAWHTTYGLPVIVTNCGNNYGPFQAPEKLIPYMIGCAVAGIALPIFGSGNHVRDWIHVTDHVQGLRKVLSHGKPGETYLFGANCELKNIDLVKMICRHLDKLVPRAAGPYENLIKFVADRPGHDWRYALDCTRTKNELNWSPTVPFHLGLSEVVTWYVENRDIWFRQWKEYFELRVAEGQG